MVGQMKSSTTLLKKFCRYRTQVTTDDYFVTVISLTFLSVTVLNDSSTGTVGLFVVIRSSFGKTRV